MVTLRMALRKMHARAMGDASVVYMSIPADRTRDADLLLDDALDELANYRALDQSAAMMRDDLQKVAESHTIEYARSVAEMSLADVAKVTP